MAKLVTFGCSWTYGIGSTYTEGVTQDQYSKLRQDDECSFRKILCERHNFSNVNFSQGGSSNQRQFRLATEYFNKPIEEETIVLWGITSTARNEFWSNHKGKICSIHYNVCTSNPLEKLSDLMRRNHYNHESEVSILTERMLHWNNYFRMLGVKNYWFDTFSHNDYDIPNMCWRSEKPRDLLSKLTGIDEDKIHFSNWKNDCVRITKGVEDGTLNPYTFHPTRRGHEIISDMFTRHLFLLRNGVDRVLD